MVGLECQHSEVCWSKFVSALMCAVPCLRCRYQRIQIRNAVEMSTLVDQLSLGSREGLEVSPGPRKGLENSSR